jgi:hypothetical protein
MAITKVTRDLLNTSIVDNGNATAITIDSSENVGIGTSNPIDKLHVAGNSSTRNTIVSNVTLDGGTAVANPYTNFGFGIDFIGLDYGDAVRNYASIYTIMDSHTSSAGGGDAGFKAGLSFYTNGGGASDTNPTERLRINSNGSVNISSDWLQLFGNNTLFSSSGAGGLIIQSPSGADTTIFRTSSATERLRILAGGGITFNGDTAAANALDDYEEGTWTPALNAGTLSAVSAQYTKVGRVVTLTVDITVGTGGGSTISNAPFTAGSTVATGIFTTEQNFNAGRTAPTIIIGGGSTTMYFRDIGDNVAYQGMALTAGAGIAFSFTYIAA